MKVAVHNWGATHLKGDSGMSDSQDPLFKPLPPFF